MANPLYVRPIAVVPRQEQNVYLDKGFKNYGNGADI